MWGGGLVRGRARARLSGVSPPYFKLFPPVPMIFVLDLGPTSGVGWMLGLSAEPQNVIYCDKLHLHLPHILEGGKGGRSWLIIELVFEDVCFSVFHTSHPPVARSARDIHGPPAPVAPRCQRSPHSGRPSFFFTPKEMRRVQQNLFCPH